MKRGRQLVEKDFSDAISVTASSSAPPSKRAKSSKAEDCCKRCWTPCEDPNPIVKDREVKAKLPQSKGYGCCDICRGFCRKHYVGQSDKDMTDLLKDAEARTEYKGKWLRYVRLKNGESPESVFIDDSGPLQKVQDERSEHLLTKVHISNFWPCVDYESFFKKKPDKVAIQEGIDRFGRACKGVIRAAVGDASLLEDKPVAVNPLWKEVRAGASIAKVVSRSDQQMDDGETASAWDHLKKKYAVTAVPTSNEGHATAGLKRQLAADDSDDDDFSSMNIGPVAAADVVLKAVKLEAAAPITPLDGQAPTKLPVKRAGQKPKALVVPIN